MLEAKGPETEKGRDTCIVVVTSRNVPGRIVVCWDVGTCAVCYV